MEINIRRFHIATGITIGTVGPYMFVATIENERRPSNVAGGRVRCLGIIDPATKQHVVRCNNAFAPDVAPATRDANRALDLVLETCNAAPIVAR